MPAQKPPEHVYDVVIVGAGYAGLSAALRLKDSGVTNICLVEAQYRIGGRVWSEKATLDNGDSVYWDAGAAFVGPLQNRLLHLADRFGVEPYKVYCTGKNVTKYKDEILRYTGLIPKKFSYDHILSLLDSNHMIRSVDALCARIDLDDVQKSDFSKSELDALNNISVSDWVYSTCTNQKARDISLTAIGANMCLDPSRVSMLAFVKDIKGGGGLMHSLENDGGSQDSRFHGRGTYGICQAILKELETSCLDGKRVVRLGSLVKSVMLCDTLCDTDSSTQKLVRVAGVCGSGVNFQVYGKYAIATMPANLYDSVAFSPKLSPLRESYAQHMKMGCVIKCEVFYKKAFWRESGFSGLVFNVATSELARDEELFVAAYDDCKPNSNLYPAGLACYIVSEQALKEAQRHSKQDQMLRRQKLCKVFAKVFDNQQAIDGCIGYAEKIWDQGYYPTIGGGFGPCLTMTPDGMDAKDAKDSRQRLEGREGAKLELIDFGDEVCEKTFEGKLLFASGENARVFAGYIDGAIESGDLCGWHVTKMMSENGADGVKIFDFIKDMPAPAGCKVKEQDIELGWIERNVLPSAWKFQWGVRMAAGVMGLLGLQRIRSKL